MLNEIDDALIFCSLSDSGLISSDIIHSLHDLRVVKNVLERPAFQNRITQLESRRVARSVVDRMPIIKKPFLDNRTVILSASDNSSNLTVTIVEKMSPKERLRIFSLLSAPGRVRMNHLGHARTWAKSTDIEFSCRSGMRVKTSGPFHFVKADSDWLGIGHGLWNAPRFASCAAWSQQLYWSVTFRRAGTAGIRVVTDPIGVQALLRERDNPNHDKRRSPVRHWQKEHVRKHRTDKQLEIVIRAALKGRSIHSIFGMEAEIIPSRDDLETAEIFALISEVNKKLAMSKRNI